MGRDKGTPNKRSQMLLRKLEDDHKFFVVNELIELYGYDKQILISLAKTIGDNIAADRPPTHDMTEEQVDMYNAANKNATGILVRLLAYLYPKLKATEISSGTGDKVIFNINTLPEVSSEKHREQPEQPKHKGQVIPIK
jgi:hypothetical protein